MYPRSTSYYRPGFGTKARVSVLVVEPKIVHERHLTKLLRFHRRFFRVLSAYAPLISAIPNGIQFPFGSTWVPNWETLDTTKSKMTSLIASSKRTQPGHHVRHEIADWAQAHPEMALDTIGGGYKPFDEKSDGHAPYMFSVVIENAQEPDYFTEKLIDSILCESIPIYYGCPNIAHYLDTDAMIICNSAEDIKAAVRSASAERFEEMLPALRRVKPKAAWFGATEKRAAEAIIEAARQEG
ncbi:glycosyltransferase family 10 domain-containing protein [Shimia sp. FJ5]|uniref:glycosyltransferase family 10 domain-containing protein n=1 Tax=Shimia sp. FJ5 TaxID=3079054 RepID=UPI0026073A60|nr:glycosyltransferase family 10 [Shimia sp. FJ5]MDV4145920.1 glycosyltransferase family 10 [Shimia sp. FJ5]